MARHDATDDEWVPNAALIQYVAFSVMVTSSLVFFDANTPWGFAMTHYFARFAV